MEFPRILKRAALHKGIALEGKSSSRSTEFPRTLKRAGSVDSTSANRVSLEYEPSSNNDKYAPLSTGESAETRIVPGLATCIYNSKSSTPRIVQFCKRKPHPLSKKPHHLSKKPYHLSKGFQRRNKSSQTDTEEEEDWQQQLEPGTPRTKYGARQTLEIKNMKKMVVVNLTPTESDPVAPPLKSMHKAEGCECLDLKQGVLINHYLGSRGDYLERVHRYWSVRYSMLVFRVRR
ncbi:unnamed protein product [Ectocarpus sp. CCAP 1310/34]|nr:unnamed protein product [Ectocarpus sp. CCAP 1310/34]